MDALVLIAKLAGLGAVFVVTVGVIDRFVGAGYGRRGRLPPRLAPIVGVIAALAMCFLVALMWIRWIG